MLTNLFIVIPSFVVLILISASFKDGRSLTLIGLIIGATTWTWNGASGAGRGCPAAWADGGGTTRRDGVGGTAASRPPVPRPATRPTPMPAARPPGLTPGP